MAANVESMFYVRETPWHGLGTKVLEAPASKDALQLAGLDWRVLQEPIYTAMEELVDGYKANVRDSDRKVLGVVTDRYRVVQNTEAFAFTDHFSVKGCSMKPQARLWVEGRYGFWQGCRGSLSLQEREFPRIWYSAIPMTVRVQSV